MITLKRPPRPRLTLRIVAFALINVFGLSAFAIGASWFAAGKGAIIEGFPSSPAEAVACAAAGIVVMFWAALRIQQEIAKQWPDLQARYARYFAENHPDKLDKLPPE